MPCMCGDTRCFSCGPAQGNNCCEICGKWDDEGGCVDREACERGYEELAKQEAELDRLSKKYWAEEEAARLLASDDCPHGRPWASCNDCMIASDFAYDAMRERMG